MKMQLQARDSESKSWDPPKKAWEPKYERPNAQSSYFPGNIGGFPSISWTFFPGKNENPTYGYFQALPGQILSF